MFPNIDLSNKNFTTNINTTAIDNNCSNDKDIGTDLSKNHFDSVSKVIIVTKHLSIPCPRLYADIFDTVLIICKDPSHKQDEFAEDNKVDEKIERFLKSNIEKPSCNNKDNFNLDYNDNTMGLSHEPSLIYSNITKKTKPKKLSNPIISENFNQTNDSAITEGVKSNVP